MRGNRLLDLVFIEDSNLTSESEIFSFAFDIANTRGQDYNEVWRDIELKPREAQCVGQTAKGGIFRYCFEIWGKIVLA